MPNSKLTLVESPYLIVQTLSLILIWSSAVTLYSWTPLLLKISPNLLKSTVLIVPDSVSILTCVFENSNILTVPDVVGKTLDGDGTKEGTQGYLEFTIKSNSNKKVNYTIIADDNNNSKDNNKK